VPSTDLGLDVASGDPTESQNPIRLDDVARAVTELPRPVRSNAEATEHYVDHMFLGVYWPFSPGRPDTRQQMFVGENANQKSAGKSLFRFHCVAQTVAKEIDGQHGAEN